MANGIYKAKRLIPGAEVNPKYKGEWLVAVPKQTLDQSGPVVIVNSQGRMVLEQVDKEGFVEKRKFEDKYRPGQFYTLVYFAWAPIAETQQTLF